MPEPEKNAETPQPKPGPGSEPEAEGVRAIRHLVRLMKKYDLPAIDFLEGRTQIRLRRRGPEVAPPVAYTTHHTYGPAFPPPGTEAAPASQVQAPPPNPATPAAAVKGVVIESPMVGTFYTSPSPDAPPFVNVGSSIQPGTTVGIIEAMKVFTDIPAGVAGTVAEILVKSGQAVEFGQPLFRVTPA